MNCFRSGVIKLSRSRTSNLSRLRRNCIFEPSRLLPSVIMPLPPKLHRELEEARALGRIEVVEDPWFVNLLFKDFSIGDGFNMRTCELLIRVPRSYPDTGPDMFWTAPELLLADGGVPQAADCIEDHVG